MVFLRASEAAIAPHRQPGRFVQRNPTRQTEIPHSHGMDSKAKMISQSPANENDDRSQSLPRWLKLNRPLSATERANLPASCCHGLAFSRRRSGDLERVLRPRFTASPQPQLLSAQSRVRCKVIHTTPALVGAARNQPAGRSGSQPVSSSEVVSVTNLRVLSGSTSRCRCCSCRCCSCCCRHVLSLSALSTNGWSFAEPHPASGSARDEFLCSLAPSPRPDLARRSDQGITGFGMFTDDTGDTRLTRPGLPRGGGGAPNQQERTGTNKPCLAFLG